MSDVSRIVERLRKNDLLTRKLCPEDRRSVDVVLTPKGLELIEYLDHYNDKIDGLLSKLNETEIKQLNQILDKIREHDEEL